MLYQNPTPVVVGLVFNREQELLVIRRSIEPNIGELALPGGYLETAEDWRVALQREIAEEAQVIVSTDPKHMKVWEVSSTPDRSKLLIFAMIKSDGIIKVCEFEENDEVSERLFSLVDYYSSPTLCFPLHRAAVKKFRDTISHSDQHAGGW